MLDKVKNVIPFEMMGSFGGESVAILWYWTTAETLKLLQDCN